MAAPLRVVAVDDSRLMRGLIRTALEAEGDIRAVGLAEDVAEGRRLIRELDPDVVTLDVEMPGMNGLAFLEKIMTLRPTPVVMVSSLTAEGAEATLEALRIGAVDVVRKPSGPDPLGPFGRELRDKVRLAARARVRRPGAAPAAAARPTAPAPSFPAGPTPFSAASSPAAVSAPSPGAPPRPLATPARGPTPLADAEAPGSAEAPRPAARPPASGRRRALIAVGASTGGVAALSELFEGLPPGLPPIVVTQHMPEGYTDRFARRLAERLRRDVAEARDGEPLAPGMIRIAPGARHLEVAAAGGRLVTRLGGAEPVSGHCPSVDVLFGSAAEAAGALAVGVILTGMGRDGALGLRAMRRAGAACLGQSERSCVVYGMPRAARELGAVDEELDLDRLPARIVDFALAAPERRAFSGA